MKIKFYQFNKNANSDVLTYNGCHSKEGNLDWLREPIEVLYYSAYAPNVSSGKTRINEAGLGGNEKILHPPMIITIKEK